VRKALLGRSMKITSRAMTAAAAMRHTSARPRYFANSTVIAVDLGIALLIAAAVSVESKGPSAMTAARPAKRQYLLIQGAVIVRTERPITFRAS